MSDATITVSFEALTETVAQVAEALLSCSLKSATQMAGRDAIDDASTCACALELSHASGSFNVVVACHPTDAQRLASQMTGKSGQSLTPNLIADACNEWLNILAGQVKSLAGLDHTMALPRMLDAEATHELAGIDAAHGLRIELQGIEVVLWLGLVGGPNVKMISGG